MWAKCPEKLTELGETQLRGQMQISSLVVDNTGFFSTTKVRGGVEIKQLPNSLNDTFFFFLTTMFVVVISQTVRASSQWQNTMFSQL